jgi:hypothetical protein
MPQTPVAGFSKMVRLTARLWVLTGLWRIAEAQKILDDAVAAVWEVGNPLFIALVTGFGYGRVFADSDPARALRALREAVEYSRQHHLLYTELYNSYELAVAEIAHGDFRRGLELLDFTIDAWHRAGDRWNLAQALASLAICLERFERAEAAAAVYGSSTRMVAVPPVAGLLEACERLRATLGSAVFDQQVATGAAMETGDAVAYARQHIQLARQAALAGRDA